MLRIVAIIVVRNGAPTLGRVLSHFRDNRIDVIAIDHGSVDATPDILAAHSPAPVIEVSGVPFDGVHRWQDSLGRKVQAAARVPHDWIIHADADEIMESPRAGERLRDLLERVDRGGFDTVACDEFVFVPTDESEDHSGGDFVATMRRYYHLHRPGRSLQRAVRRGSSPPEWMESGGHLAGRERHVAPERIRLRHYVGLSFDHVRSQYLGRVFDGEALLRGWHRRRVPTTPAFVTHPPADRLLNLDTDGWSVARSEARHLIFHQPVPYRPPAVLPADTTRPPMPFVVGVGRSGTTLLRLMLDAHPDLAITPETHWLKSAIDLLDQRPDDIDTLRRALIADELFGHMQIEEDELDAILGSHDASDPYDALRSIYRVYAARFRASRAGDKTPNHGLSMTTIARALPEARFVHIIRDGRDVAVSHRGLWFGPGDDVKDAAIFWLWRIREMRQQAQFLPHYLEVRYEDLVCEPEAALRRIGTFIEVPFHPAQLEAHRRASERLSELTARVARGQLISAERRRSIHRWAEKPPDPSRIGRWKREMTSAEVCQFERIAGVMLRDLGYDPGCA